MDALVTYEVTDRIGYITLNRPDKRNALSYEMVDELKKVFKQAFSDSNCKVVVLKANGEAFCSGADLLSLQKLQTNSYDENLSDSKHLMELFKLIYKGPKVVISMVQGAAFAGGCGLASICDFTFATQNAKFAYTEVRIGFIPAIVMVFLIRKIGENNAKKLLLTGKVIETTEALDMGLITHFSDEELIEEEVHAFATQLCKQNSEQSMQLTKQMLAEIPEMTLDNALEYAARANAAARASADCQRGIAAFLNKEKLIW